MTPTTWIDQLLEGTPSVYNVGMGQGLLDYVQQNIQLNPEQADACFTPLHQPLQVLAGAGTGKTMLITARYLTLLHELLHTQTPQAESRILVMTFTKKAAGEMKERIHHHLKQAGYTGALPDENITTFNSFGQGFLMRHAQEAGLKDGVSVLDDVDQASLKTAINQRILKGKASNLQSTLERYGLFPVPHESYPLSLRERAGVRDSGCPIEAGESLHLASSLREEEQQGIAKDVLAPAKLAEWGLKKDPDAFLDTVWEVIQKAKSYGLDPQAFRRLARQQCLAFSDTVKSLPTTEASTLTELYTSWARHLKTLSTPAWEENLRPLSDWKDDKDAYKALLDPAVFKAHPAIQISRVPKIDGILPPDAVDWHAVDAHTQSELAFVDVITAVYALYQERLLLDGVIDYDDQINLTLHTLQTNDALRRKYQDWFSAIMVDEFQDTNGSQLALLKCLMRHPDNGWQDVPNHGNLTVVGDVKQSIYSFRFAQKENVSLIFEGLTPKKVSLVRNYRCRAGILHVANQVADHTAETPAMRDPHLEAFKASDDKHPTEATAYYFGTQSDGKKWEGSASLRFEHASQTLVQGLIQDYLSHQDHETPFLWKSHCILGRSHSQLQSVANLLEAKNIPFVMERDGAMFAHPLIQQAWAFLEAVKDPTNPMWIVKLLSPFVAPLRLLHAVQAVESVPHPSPLPKGEGTFVDKLLDALAQTDGITAHTMQTLTTLLHAVLQTHQHHAFEAPQTLVAQFNDALLASQPPSKHPAKERALLLAFGDLCQRHYERLGKRYSVSELMKGLEKDKANPQFSLPLKHIRSARGVNAVRLMTFHASKGLEFPHVHVLWFGKTPSNQAGMSFDPQFKPKAGVGFILHKTLEDDVDTLKYSLYKSLWRNPRDDFESRRLLYVALTRAEKSVHFYADAQKLAKDPWLKLKASPQKPEQVQIFEENEDEEPFTVFYDAFKNAPILPNPQDAKDSVGAELPRLSPRLKERLDAFNASQEAVSIVSFSGLQELEKCPLKYWFQQIRRLPMPKESETLESLTAFERAPLRGKTVHRLIETYYRYASISEKGVLDERLDTVMRQSLGHLSEGDHALIQAEVLNMYDGFLKSEFTLEGLDAQGYTVLAPEQSVRFKLLPSLTGGRLAHIVKGQVDAILYHKATDSYGLIDFKTNLTLKEDAKARYYEQMALYRLGLQLNNPHVQVEASRCALVHLAQNALPQRYELPETYHLHDELAVTPWLKTTLHQLEGLLGSPEAEPKASMNPPCEHCAYKSTCNQAV
jgi:ATP-dependent exoDNAse (exonuclease V) beta subunit